MNPTLRAFFVLSACAVIALFAGYMLSTDLLWMVIYIGVGFSVVTLPIHGWMAPRIFFATFLSTILVPLAPGRPYLWEAALLACWTGLVMSTVMRRLDPEFRENFRRYRWILIGSVLYSVVLVGLMLHHGAGLRVLGTGTVGGRFYFQQIISAIIPVAFLAHPLKERELRVLFLVAAVLSLSAFVADMAFSYGGILEPALIFLGTPGDAGNFEQQALAGKLRRFQSFATVSQAFIFYLLARFGPFAILSWKKFWLAPLVVVLLAVGLLSGHRLVIYSVVSTAAVYCVACRFVNFRTSFAAAGAGLVALAFIYAFADKLPETAQRALSILPGLEVSRLVEGDGFGTFETRRLLRQVGWEMMPDHLLVGRGFNIPEGYELAILWDPTGVAQFAAMGRFFNGFIGQMVNTGLPGLLTMAIVWIGGCRLAWRLLKRCWDGRANTFALRVGALFASQWISTLFTYIFLHGDSENGLRTFTPIIGFMIATEIVIRRTAKLPAEEPVRPVLRKNSGLIEESSPRLFR